MNLRQITLKIIIYLFFAFALYAKSADSLKTDTISAIKLIDVGRQLFYESVEDESKLDSAISVFEKLKADFPEFEGRAITYIGALTALKAKHTFWVYTKYTLAVDGLDIMDQGIYKSPNDIEALFVYGSTCFYMPFLFARSDEAQKAFKRILELLPQQINNYDPELMKNVINFLLQNAELTIEEQTQLINLKEYIVIE